MEVKFKTSRSSIRPELLDKTSSKTQVFVRQNIKEVMEKDQEGNDVTTFEFEEARLSKQEYALYVVANALQDADVEVQLALAELAEMVDASNTNMELALAELAEAMMA